MSVHLTRRRGNRVLATLLALAVVASVVAAVPLAAAATAEQEPNGSFENAQSITLGETVTGVNGDESDTFSFTATKGETINFTLASIGGGTYMALYDKDGNRITRELTNDDGTTIGTTATYTGTYYVSLFPRFRSSNVSYEFTVDTYQTDGAEPNEDRGNATQITPGETVTGEISAGDDDWFRFTAEAGETINLTASLSGAGATNVNVVDRNGNELSQISDSGSTGVTATYTGTYYARLSPDFGNFGQEYNFTVETYRTDGFEPNEDYANGTRLYENPFAPDNATITLGDTDWFTYRLAAGETVRVTANTPPGTGNRYVSIGTPDQSFPNQSKVEPEFTTVLSYTASSSGLYSVSVEPWFDVTGPYSVTVTVNGEELGLPNDRFERGNPPVGNQGRQAATPIESGTYRNLGMVDDDEDWFRLRAAKDARVTVNTSYNSSANTLSVALLRGDGTPVASGGDSLARNVSAAGTYYLRVTGQANAEATYTLDVNVSAAGPSSLPRQAAAPTDTDGDGRYEDVNGDGGLNVIDVSILLGVFDQVPSGETAFYDYNGDGSLNILDVAALLKQT